MGSGKEEQSEGPPLRVGLRDASGQRTGVEVTCQEQVRECWGQRDRARSSGAGPALYGVKTRA